MYELLTSEAFYDTRIPEMPENPFGAWVKEVDYKVRFECPSCKHTWTSGLGQLAVILLLGRAPGGLLSITFRVIAYWFECKACGKRGDMKAYEDEMERIAVIVTKKALKRFGGNIEQALDNVLNQL